MSAITKSLCNDRPFFANFRFNLKQLTTINKLNAGVKRLMNFDQCILDKPAEPSLLTMASESEI